MRACVGAMGREGTLEQEGVWGRQPVRQVEGEGAGRIVNRTHMQPPHAPGIAPTRTCSMPMAISCSTSQSVNPSVNQSIKPSVNQTISQSNHQSIKPARTAPAACAW